MPYLLLPVMKLFSCRGFSVLLCMLAGMVLMPELHAKPYKPGWHTEQLYHEGALRQYRLYVPAIPGKERAVVVLFHDGGENMNNLLGKYGSGTNRWVDLAESDGFVLLVPNGIDLKTGEGRGNNLYWNDCRPDSKRKNRRSLSDDVDFIRIVLDALLLRSVEYDPSRVYVTGSGEGGLMALRMTFEAPDVVAAAAVVNCSLPLNTQCNRSKLPVPMLLINGTRDEVFPWIGGNIGDRHGFVTSVPKMRNYLSGYNQVAKDHLVLREFSDKVPEDGCLVKVHFFPGLERGADLSFYTIEGGGHAIPSIRYPQPKKFTKKFGNQCLDVETAVEAWNFLRAYSTDTKLRGDRL